MQVELEKLTIVHYPHPALRRKCRPIQRIDEQVVAVARRMLELMHEHHGVGLAAPQVDLDWRLFVANATGDPEDDRIYINPRLTEPSAETESHEEGCLSIPYVTGQIMRPRAITITAQGPDGQTFSDRSEELPARIWQHETDHLNGTLILDRMNELDKRANRRAVQELEAAFKK